MRKNKELKINDHLSMIAFLSGVPWKSNIVTQHTFYILLNILAVKGKIIMKLSQNQMKMNSFQNKWLL